MVTTGSQQGSPETPERKAEKKRNMWTWIFAGSLVLLLIAAIAIPKYLSDREIARAEQCEANLKAVVSALDSYNVDHGGYPKSLSELARGGKYITELPRCPSAHIDTYTASYTVEDNGQGYAVFCKGHYHERAGLEANMPMARTGVVSRTPLPSKQAPRVAGEPTPKPEATQKTSPFIVAIPTPEAEKTAEKPEKPPVAVVPSPQVAPATKCTENINRIAVACESYKADLGSYPVSLSQLVPDYLVSIPVCPAAHADTYSASFTTKETVSGPSFTVFCKGAYHTFDGFRKDHPRYTSETGMEKR
ncbi:MAG: hypothetical protein HYU64_03925 [Armatimonadetes bacterium]|nr:hypothetical protein [Armatimonadota bacterium]